jgi:hypothetical protein
MGGGAGVMGGGAWVVRGNAWVGGGRPAKVPGRVGRGWGAGGGARSWFNLITGAEAEARCPPSRLLRVAARSSLVCACFRPQHSTRQCWYLQWGRRNAVITRSYYLPKPALPPGFFELIRACLWSRLVAAFQPSVTIAFGRTPRENDGSAITNAPNARHQNKL